MSTKIITGAEIFASGTWNGLTFSDDDLDQIVRAFDALQLSGRVPLKLGHEGPDVREDPTTQFAMGWVTKVWRDGKRLLADMSVPDKVYDLIKAGFLKFVSVELLRDVKASTRNIPWVLDAVALLGSDQPAVGTLKDLQALTMARDFEFASRATFARAEPLSFQQSTGARHSMSDDNNSAIGTLQAKLLELGSRVEAVESENRALRNENADLKQVKGRFERLSDQVKQSEVNAHRTAIKNRIEAAVKAEDILPAARERFNKIYRVEDNEAVMKIDMQDVEEFIQENPNAAKKRKERKVALVSLATFADDVPDTVPVDQEATLRVRAWFKEQGIKNPTADDWQRGTVEVFRALPDVAQRYKAAADAAYGS